MLRQLICTMALVCHRHTGSIGNCFIVKFMIENHNILKIAPFAALPISQYHVFFSKTSFFVVGQVLSFQLRLNIQRVILQDVFITGREITNVILTNRHCCKRRNFRKIAIFNHHARCYNEIKC